MIPPGRRCGGLLLRSVTFRQRRRRSGPSLRSSLHGEAVGESDRPKGGQKDLRWCVDGGDLATASALASFLAGALTHRLLALQATPSTCQSALRSEPDRSRPWAQSSQTIWMSLTPNPPLNPKITRLYVPANRRPSAMTPALTHFLLSRRILASLIRSIIAMRCFLTTEWSVETSLEAVAFAEPCRRRRFRAGDLTEPAWTLALVRPVRTRRADCPQRAPQSAFVVKEDMGIRPFGVPFWGTAVQTTIGS